MNRQEIERRYNEISLVLGLGEITPIRWYEVEHDGLLLIFDMGHYKGATSPVIYPTMDKYRVTQVIATHLANFLSDF